MISVVYDPRNYSTYLFVDICKHVQKHKHNTSQAYVFLISTSSCGASQTSRITVRWRHHTHTVARAWLI